MTEDLPTDAVHFTVPVRVLIAVMAALTQRAAFAPFQRTSPTREKADAERRTDGK